MTVRKITSPPLRRHGRQVQPLRGCAVAVTLAAVLFATELAHAATEPVALRVYDQNIEGAANPDVIGRTIANFGPAEPDILALEEVCASQEQDLRTRRPGWSTAWTRRQDAPSCSTTNGAPAKLGIMLASPYPLRNVAWYKLRGYTHSGELSANGTPQPPRTFRLLCADIAMPGSELGSLRACVVHLRPGFRYDYQFLERKREAQDIAAVVNPWIDAGKHVVLAGDFNAVPTLETLDPIYHLDNQGSYSGAGRFIEGDQFDSRWFPDGAPCEDAGRCRSGAPTNLAGSKIDYVFYSHFDLSGVGAYVPPPNGSDHAAIRSTAIYRLPVDITAPETLITKTPKSRLKTRERKVRVGFRFEADEPASFECRLTGKPGWSDCGSPARYWINAGRIWRRHVFQVRATDAPANRDATPARYTFKVRRQH